MIDPRAAPATDVTDVTSARPAAARGTLTLGADGVGRGGGRAVTRLGFGAMRLTGQASGARPPTPRSPSVSCEHCEAAGIAFLPWAPLDAAEIALTDAESDALTALT
jgi:hypothetical protein